MPTRKASAGSIVLTCEHAGNAVPALYRAALRPASRWLATHRGYDPGALPIAKSLSKYLAAPLVTGSATRLLVELNRSPDSPELFSTWSSKLSDAQKRRVIAEVYEPFRAESRRLIESAMTHSPQRRAVHLSVHTFTPVRKGQRRSMHVGILFDPARAHEAALAERWRVLLTARLPRLIIALNQPYLGTDDGHTTLRRREFSDPQYSGIELEVRQDLWRRSDGGRSASWKTLVKALAETFSEAL